MLPLVSGPQGPRVVLDGRPVLTLCSDNHLGLADHPRLREAAADAALRWGAGAGGPRGAAGTMTVHRRLEEGLAAFAGTEAAFAFASVRDAAAAVLPALAGPGTLLLVDELCRPALADAARLSGADVVAYRHGDVEHLAWAAGRADGAGGVALTEAVFALDGDLAPLAELADACRAAGLRLVVDETHATGTMGPDGRGAVADAQLTGEVALVLGGLGEALGAAGAFAATDAATARAIATRSPAFAAAATLAPPVAAAALAALELVGEQPRRADKLAANAEVLRSELAREGFDVAGSTTHVIPLVVGDAGTALRLAELARERGVHTQAVVPPAVPDGTARLRLAVMASHTKPELREAARVLGRAALLAGFRPGTAMPVLLAQAA